MPNPSSQTTAITSVFVACHGHQMGAGWRTLSHIQRKRARSSSAIWRTVKRTSRTIPYSAMLHRHLIPKASSSTSWAITASILYTTTCNLTLVSPVACAPTLSHCGVTSSPRSSLNRKLLERKTRTKERKKRKQQIRKQKTALKERPRTQVKMKRRQPKKRLPCLLTWKASPLVQCLSH